MIPPLWCWWFEDFSLCFSFPCAKFVCLPAHVSTEQHDQEVCVISNNSCMGPIICYLQSSLNNSYVGSSRTNCHLMGMLLEHKCQPQNESFLLLLLLLARNSDFACAKPHSAIEIQPLLNLAQVNPPLFFIVLIMLYNQVRPKSSSK